MGELRTFLLVDGDLAFDLSRNIIFTQGDTEISQSLERVFTTNAGEWFLNAAHGLEYPRIQGKGITDENIQLAIIQAALQDQRVTEVLEINIEHDNVRRRVLINFLCHVNTGAVLTVPFEFKT